MQTTSAKAQDRSAGRAPIFDPLMDHCDEFLANPYPALNALREGGAVQWSQKGRQWLVSGYEEAVQMMRSSAFGKRIERWKHPSLLMRLVISIRSRSMRSMLIEDPPEHTRLRSLVNNAFTPSVVQGLVPHIQEIADQLVDSFEADGQADLVSQYAFVLPVTVIAELLGVPVDDRERFKSWSSQITGGLRGGFCPVATTRSLLANQSLMDYLRRIIRDKRQRPQADLISSLVAVEAQGDGRLSEPELISNSLLLLLAGHETTVNLIGNALYNLLKQPSQLKLLMEEPALIDSAVEEFLRFDPPVQFVRRVAAKDTVIAGQSIRKDDAATVLLGACNRDPAIFEVPDLMDIRRKDNKHLAFGSGIHFCLGAELARAEARIAILTILRRLPSLELACSEPVYKGPFLLRGHKHLRVNFARRTI